MDAILDERGDVPGWVLITLMTAGLVVVIWSAVSPGLENIIDDSLNRVSLL